MSTSLDKKEVQVLSEVIKEYLTNLRTEILDTPDPHDRETLEEKESALRKILAGFEKRPLVSVRER